MAKKRSPAAEERPSVTNDVYTRLYRLLQLLAGPPQTRAVLLRRLGADVRKFYRDLGMLRSLGVTVAVADGRYHLADAVEAACERLPFPDPHLTLGEVRALARGRGAAQRRLREMLERLAPHKAH
jgi:predicted DNA-binding transcriptional regulator YafY